MEIFKGTGYGFWHRLPRFLRAQEDEDTQTHTRAHMHAQKYNTARMKPTVEAVKCVHFESLAVKINSQTSCFTSQPWTCKAYHHHRSTEADTDWLWLKSNHHPSWTSTQWLQSPHSAKAWDRQTNRQQKAIAIQHRLPYFKCSVRNRQPGTEAKNTTIQNSHTLQSILVDHFSVSVSKGSLNTSFPPAATNISSQ